MAAPIAAPPTVARMPAAAPLAAARIFGADRKKAVAQEFEAVFLSNMLEEMFAGLEDEGPMGSGAGAGTWRSFLTDQYAKTIAAKGGVGLADHVHRQLIAMQENSQ
jgi:Rod binding domain-containing protein